VTSGAQVFGIVNFAVAADVATVQGSFVFVVKRPANELEAARLAALRTKRDFFIKTSKKN
jgi:hypothetical protein